MPNSLRTKSAYGASDFYDQLKQGGESGWNDIYVDPTDLANNRERFYLKYYDAIIASIERVNHEGKIHCKITVFGESSKSPIQNHGHYPPEQWEEMYKNVIEAMQALYQL